MTSKPTLPTPEAIAQDLRKLRRFGIGRIDVSKVPTLRRCAVAAELAESVAVSADAIATLVRRGAGEMVSIEEQEAVACLYGFNRELRNASAEIRRGKAASALGYRRASNFTRNRENELIEDLAQAVRSFCLQQLEAADAGNGDGPQWIKKKLFAERFRAWWQTLREWLAKVRHWLLYSETRKLAGIVGAALLGGFAIFSACKGNAPVVMQDSTPPTVVAQPFGGEQAPDNGRGITEQVYLEGSRFAQKEFEDPGFAYCGVSPSSSRADAYICAVPPDLWPAEDQKTRAVMDPCFAVDADSVVCHGNGRTGPYPRFHVQGGVQVEKSPKWEGDADWPWQVVLADGNTCQRMASWLEAKSDSPNVDLRTRQKVPADSPYYQCSREEKRYLAIDWVLSESGRMEIVTWAKFGDGKSADAMQLEKRGDDTWHIRYSPQMNTAYTLTRVSTMVF
ncbi:hypothetical protein IU510_14700 [Nocardia cyriacigeorgica]|uniref:hypothetical protein n=1 Tax=Nocardia cyriacigeorgica TaxID=135487 RepID=UPI001894A348|nr:hypothetical protein [Nocardia cyriacigeorgica]MBF6099327.1 hypothetical protein [Nocardia cyriacigeorgica]